MYSLYEITLAINKSGETMCLYCIASDLEEAMKQCKHMFCVENWDELTDTHWESLQEWFDVSLVSKKCILSIFAPEDHLVVCDGGTDMMYAIGSLP